MSSYKRFAAYIAVAIASTVSTQWCYGSNDVEHPRYRTTKLRLLASATGISATIDTLADGCYRGIHEWQGHPLSIEVEDGEVRHIGMQLFASSERDSMSPSPVYDFVERYMLEGMTLPGPELLNADRMDADRVTVDYGSIRDFLGMTPDTTLMFISNLHESRNYSIAWIKDHEPVFGMTFPANFRLMKGYAIDECEELLKREITKTENKAKAPITADPGLMEEPDDSVKFYRILRGDSYILPVINNDRYYFVADSTAKLVYSPAFPVESLANLLVTGEIDNSYTAQVDMLRYGHNRDSFGVPLNALLNCCFDQGCIPYFAVKKLDTETGRISALLELVNRPCGYEHLMSIVYDVATLPKRGGDIKVTLVPYLPLHDIKSLYK